MQCKNGISQEIVYYCTRLEIVVGAVGVQSHTD